VDEHWEPERAARGAVANYVRIEFDVLLDPATEEPLGGVGLSFGALASVNWSPFASGTQIPSEALPALEKAWRSYIAALRPDERGRHRHRLSR
jgi:hypothetical protein